MYNLIMVGTCEDGKVPTSKQEVPLPLNELAEVTISTDRSANSKPAGPSTWRARYSVTTGFRANSKLMMVVML